MKRHIILVCVCLLWSLAIWQGGCGPVEPKEEAKAEAAPDATAPKDEGTDKAAPPDERKDAGPVDNPTKDEPVKDEPVKDEPIKDEPIKDEPVKDEPIQPPTDDFIRKSGTTAKSEDQKWFVTANHDSGSLTVFQLTGDLDIKAATKFEIKLGSKGAEVSSVSMGHDGTYVLATLQYDQKVCRIDLAAGAGQTPKCEATGSEPVGVVSNEDGSWIYVSNMVDGTVTIHGKDLKKIYTWDFSDPNTGETSVNPFALLYVRKKTESAGNVYVTDFFAEKIPGKQEGEDDARQGVVYKVPGRSQTLTGQIKIDLPPLADTGFRLADDQGHCAGDATKTLAGCTKDPKGSGAYPNQLASLTFHKDRIFVLSTCASPRGDFQFNMNVHSCVHVIDVETNKELPALRMNIQERIKQQPGDKLFCTVPMDMACVKDTAFCYAACASSDLVIRLDYKDFSDAKNVIAGVPGINNLPTGKFPTGLNLFTSDTQVLAFVNNENSRDVTILNLKDQKPDGQVQATALPTDAKELEILKGKDFYYTGRGRWSKERWSSCVACHWRGLTDNVTWHFPTGPRQTISMDATFSKENVPGDTAGNRHNFAQVLQALKDNKSFPQRMLNWTAVRDEIADFELNTRGVSGGLGAIVDKDNKAIDIANFPPGANNANNNGSTLALVKSLQANGGIDDWIAITEFAKTIRSPRGKTNLPGDATAGRKLFEQTYGCAGCHSGGAWTVSRRYFDPDLDGTKVSNVLKGKFLDEFAANKNAKILALTTLIDPNAACTSDADCGNVTNACDTTAKKCRIPALGNEFRFSLNRGIDQHSCTTRNVGTFEKADAAKGGLELRKNMTTIAQGVYGFNVPSLLGLQLGAPYLHNGQYESLADFLQKDSTHRILINKVASMNDQQAKDLIAFLLSVDGSTNSFNTDSNDQLCPPTFP